MNKANLNTSLVAMLVITQPSGTSWLKTDKALVAKYQQ